MAPGKFRVKIKLESDSSRKLGVTMWNGKIPGLENFICTLGWGGENKVDLPTRLGDGMGGKS